MLQKCYGEIIIKKLCEYAPWACTVKHFTAVFLLENNKLECFTLSVTSALV
jgi:hypothetical protein